jgi:hypothetical protein
MPVRQRRASSPVFVVVVLSVLVVGCGMSGCTSSGADDVAERTQPVTSIDGVRCPEVAFVDEPAAPVSRSGMQALARLARVEADPQIAPPHGEMSGMDHGSSAASMPGAERGTLMSELHRAARAGCHLLSPAAAEAAGYYLGSPYVEGVGTHWINWEYIDRPFDPARPSMLLFKTTGDVSELAGFSYWVRSNTEPSGFAGSTDHWHRHSGLCFVAGQWAGEDVTPSECRGAWLNGRDLWMLHAWVVPGHTNPAGVFAPTSRALCRPNMPDIVACSSD